MSPTTPRCADPDTETPEPRSETTGRSRSWSARPRAPGASANTWGRPAYSYYFVVEALAPVLETFGTWRLIDHPESRLAFAAREGRGRGVPAGPPGDQPAPGRVPQPGRAERRLPVLGVPRPPRPRLRLRHPAELGPHQPARGAGADGLPVHRRGVPPRRDRAAGRRRADPRRPRGVRPPRLGPRPLLDPHLPPRGARPPPPRAATAAAGRRARARARGAAAVAPRAGLAGRAGRVPEGPALARARRRSASSSGSSGGSRRRARMSPREARLRRGARRLPPARPPLAQRRGGRTGSPRPRSRPWRWSAASRRSSPTRPCPRAC